MHKMLTFRFGALMSRHSQHHTCTSLNPKLSMFESHFPESEVLFSADQRSGTDASRNRSLRAYMYIHVHVHVNIVNDATGSLFFKP